MQNYKIDDDNNPNLLKKLGHYRNYIKVDIYYTTQETTLGSENIISKYKIYLRDTNEDITYIKTEEELRSKLGLYLLGTHTDTLTLTEINKFGIFHTTYTFVDSQNNEYEMEFQNSNDALNLTEGNTYTVTFEVTESTFDYEFNIKSIQ